MFQAPILPAFHPEAGRPEGSAVPTKDLDCVRYVPGEPLRKVRLSPLSAGGSTSCSRSRLDGFSLILLGGGDFGLILATGKGLRHLFLGQLDGRLGRLFLGQLDGRLGCVFLGQLSGRLGCVFLGQLSGRLGCLGLVNADSRLGHGDGRRFHLL